MLPVGAAVWTEPEADEAAVEAEGIEEAVVLEVALELPMALMACSREMT